MKNVNDSMNEYQANLDNIEAQWQNCGENVEALYRLAVSLEVVTHNTACRVMREINNLHNEIRLGRQKQHVSDHKWTWSNMGMSALNVIKGITQVVAAFKGFSALNASDEAGKLLRESATYYGNKQLKVLLSRNMIMK
jgi:hypothetical protein